MKMLDARAKEDSPKGDVPKVDAKEEEMVDTKKEEEMVDKKKDEEMVDKRKVETVETKKEEDDHEEHGEPVRAVENPQSFQLRPKKRPR